MEIRVVLETNGHGVLLYAENFPGAFVRGASLDEAMDKWRDEMASYPRWRDGVPRPPANITSRNGQV